LSDDRRKELQDWRATLAPHEDETVARMIEQQGEEHVLSILGHLKQQLEYVRSLCCLKSTIRLSR
jgi:hypothetical protein